MQIDVSAARARWSLGLMFLVMGVSSMAWIPRIPEIKSELGLNDAQFGLMLAASSVGAVLGAQYSGRLVHRFGSKNTLRVSQVVMPLGVITMGATMTVPGVMAGLFVMGLGYAAMDIAANSQTVIAEKVLKKKFLASMHGAWSIGTFFTALFGGAVVGVLTPSENLVVLGMAALVIFVPLTEQMLPGEFDEHKGAEGTSSKMPWFGGKYVMLWAFAIGSLGSF
ncbi:MAG: MFS transporter, partial [Aquiluna sp.]